MSASIVDLCEEVRDALNGEFWSQSFTAVFEFNPNYSVMDAKTLRVVVTDAGGEAALISRACIGYVDTVRVVVLHRVDAGATGIDTTKMKADLLLLQEIGEFLVNRPMGEYMPEGSFARANGEKDKQHYLPGNLDERLFASSILIPYQSKVNLRSTGS